MAERFTVPAIRTSSGRVITVLADGDQGVWTLDNEGASYWPGGAVELRAFAVDIEQDRLACVADGYPWPDDDDISAAYELLAAIADELTAEGA